jgi:hypothetical protein
MAAQKLKVLVALLAAMVLILAAGVAYANSTQSAGTPGAGADNGAQVADDDDSDEPGDVEEPGDADEPGDSDGPGDTED